MEIKLAKDQGCLAIMYGHDDKEHTSKLKEFCASTSAHGYGHLTKGSTPSKICWAAVLVTALFATVSHLYILSRAYLRYDYYEVISVQPDVERMCPDVTICDSAKISDYALFKFEGTRSFMFYYQSLLEEISNKSKYSAIYSKQMYSQFLLRTLEPGFILSNIASDQKTSIGIQFDSLVVDCSYKELKCDRNNFEIFVSHKYLNCYTFKANTMQSKFKSQIGSGAALSIILRGEPSYNENYQEYSKTENVDSIHIDIHPSKTIPFIESYGLDLTPGMSTSVELRQRLYERLQEPYTNCEPDVYVKVSSKEYLMEQNYCTARCARDKIYKKCNCVSITTAGVAEDFKDYCLNVEMSNSSYLNFSKAICETQAWNLFKTSSDAYWNCDRCSWNCKETKYDKKITQAKWPQKSSIDSFVNKYILSKPASNPIREYYEYLLKKLPYNLTNGDKTNQVDNSMSIQDFKLIASSTFQNKSPGGDGSFWRNVSLEPHIPDSLLQSNSLSDLQSRWIGESFYRLNVYFGEPFVTVHKQVPSFSFGDFWSAVGGVLGIWAGASVLTLLEVFSFLGSLFSKSPINICKYQNRNSKVTEISIQTKLQL